MGSAETLRRRAGRAFTLVEALVAVGAMALVTVGIAAVFQSVGKTVSAGRRVSVLNGYAAMIEQQMRRDFAGMTRDGFLMVRNSYAGATNPEPVKLRADDLSPRLRRIDELQFFSRGEFVSAREPLAPSYVASGNVARIYYGHGTRMKPGVKGVGTPANPDPYVKPEISDNNGAAGRLGEPGGPNELASSWTLLRHAAVLVTPEASQQALPAGDVFQHKPASARGKLLLVDKDGQIALQPAVNSVFRHGQYVLTTGTGAPSLNFVRSEQNFRPPTFASGLVDIINDDLTEIRAVVMSMDQDPASIPDAAAWRAGLGGTLGNTGQTAVDREHLWMEQAWPTNSNPRAAAALGQPPGTRIRCEPGPTGYDETLIGGNAQPLERAYRRADQLMLGASNFVVGCTEFIVEWTFGDVDTTTSSATFGQVVWHGLERRVDVTGNGKTTDPKDMSLTYPYPRGPSGTPLTLHKQRYQSVQDGKSQEYDVPASLIYGTAAASPLSQTAYFGYVDPQVGDGRPWAWPKMFRITITLTDPRDPTFEETFQFVLPAASDRY